MTWLQAEELGGKGARALVGRARLYAYDKNKSRRKTLPGLRHLLQAEWTFQTNKIMALG